MRDVVATLLEMRDATMWPDSVWQLTNAVVIALFFNGAIF